MAGRKIKGSWLDSFMEWTLPRSEAPASMVKWAGLFTLSSIVKRKVYFPKELMGSYAIYPNLYVIYVAEPGIARKSTTAGYAQELLLDTSSMLNGEKITIAPDVTSYSKLLNSLSESPDSSLTIVSSEFSSLVQATPEDMYELLTDVFDNKRRHNWSTWSHGDKEIKNPVINLLAATTPDWVAEQPRGYFIGGGFGSRLLLVHEKKRRQNRMYYHDLNWKEINNLGASLTLDLGHISSLKGAFAHDNAKTLAYCEQWYQVHVKKEVVDNRMKGYAERKHLHAHKIAMLLSVSEGDNLKITRKHWDEAVRLLNDIEKSLPGALSTMGKNPLGPQMLAVQEFVERKGSVSLEEVASRFFQEIASLEQLRSILAYMTVAGTLKATGKPENPTYSIKV